MPRFFPLSAIANPLATEELSTRLFDLIAKAVKVGGTKGECHQG